jgi:ABC-type lipoprotein release transport system permease subunit
MVVVAFAALSITRIFARFDAVAIVERGKLSMEARDRQRAMKRSSAKPLSSRTFYLRHRRRGLMLVLAMAFMNLGVVFPSFLASSVDDVQGSVLLSYLRHASVVSPVAYHTLDPGVTARIRTHPAVARVIPAMPLTLVVSTPPLAKVGMSVYGVSEDDLPVLVDLYGMSLKEGRLLRARSSEVVLSESVALNRGLHVGDTVGRPAQEQDDTPALMRGGIPTEMEIVGTLAPGGQWMGFASLEYLESHELYSPPRACLIVVPVEGRRAELDTWLEENVASTETDVQTYDARLREMRQGTRGMLLMLAAIESVIALVAAIALAVLNYIFFTQRHEEFGILHAMGRSRSWLVRRVAGESVGVVALAWLIGAVVCVVGLLLAQASVYAPKGLSLDFSNPTPWLFTLPIPLAVVAASAGTVTWVLIKLDPVSIIERR